MRHKTPWLLICIITVCLHSPSASFSADSQKSESQNLELADLPDHIAYEFYFLRVVVIYAKASAREREGLSGDSLRAGIAEPAALDSLQAQTVYEIASTCLAQARELDLKARSIIREVRSRYHEGKLGHGQAPPGLPPELAMLQAERNSAFLSGRTRLQKLLGLEKFNEFDRFVRSTIGQ